MIGRVLEAVLYRLRRHGRETPRRRYGRCPANVVLGPYVWATHPARVFMGNHIYIGPYAFLSSQGGLRIDDGTIIGPYLTVYTANHNYEGEALPYDGVTLLKPVVIGRNVWIGGNVVIVPGVRIGEGAVVGAGALVTKDVPDLAVVGGNPAKVIKQRDAHRYHRLAEADRVYLKLRDSGELRQTEEPPWSPQLVEAGRGPSEGVHEA